MSKEKKLEKKEKKAKAKKEKKEHKEPKKLGGLLFAKMALGGVAQLRSHADEVNKLTIDVVKNKNYICCSLNKD